MRVGLLGGSFDPVHSGHLFISLEALKKLGLNQLWWVITLQNPFKNKTFYSLEERLKLAQNQIKQFHNIKAIVGTHKSTYSQILYLQNKHSSCEFIWIMGIDCLFSLHQWYRFKEINKLVPIVIFNRERALNRAMKTKFILSTTKQQVSINNFAYKPKQICIIVEKLHNMSSTIIREELNS